MMTKRIVGNVIIILILISSVASDQITKSVVRQNLEYHKKINVVGEYLILKKVENTGAFLGLGKKLPRSIYKILMIAFPLIVIGYALYAILRRSDMSSLLKIGISFILGGGIGNIIDRIIYGSVTDFLFFDFVIFHTGIVNLADIFVTIGFFVVVYDMFVNRKKIAGGVN